VWGLWKVREVQKLYKGVFWWAALKEIYHFQNLEVDCKIILERMLKIFN